MGITALGFGMGIYVPSLLPLGHHSRFNMAFSSKRSWFEQVLGMQTSMICCTRPCSAIFFASRYYVDSYNIKHRIYFPGVESLGTGDLGAFTGRSLDVSRNRPFTRYDLIDLWILRSFSRAVRLMLETTVALWWLSIGTGCLLYLYTYFAKVWHGPVPRSVILFGAYVLLFGGLLLLIRVFVLAAQLAQRPVHVPLGAKVKKMSSVLLDKGLSTIFGELHSADLEQAEEIVGGEASLEASNDLFFDSKRLGRHHFNAMLIPFSLARSWHKALGA